MPRVSFDALPDDGRLWVFPVSRDLSDEEVDVCVSVVDEFLAQWAAHGIPLRSAREIREQRFLMIGVDVDSEAPSGCSIDALVDRLRELGEELSATFIDHSSVWYRDGTGICTASRAEFRALAKAGSVLPEAAVFDTSLTKVVQARRGSLERPASETWHGQAFFRGLL